jgi:Cu-Zn family superoxide dismutase
LGSLSTTASPTVPAVAAPAEPAAGHVAPFVYTLHGDDIFPESVAVAGDTYYVTGHINGRIYRGDLAEPTVAAEEFIDTGAEGGLGGIEVVGEHLVVARGGAGVSLYDRHTGTLLATWTVPEGSSPAHVAIAPNGDAYVIDQAPVLYRIPASELAHPRAAQQPLRIFAELIDIPFTDGFLNAFFVVATPDGRNVLIPHFTTGQLFRVRLSDKQVRPVDLGDYRLISASGLDITDDRVLYVVRPARPVVTKLRLDARYERGRVLSETTDPTFHGPSNVAIAGDRLLVANIQFFGAPPAPPWTVTSIPLP